MINPVESSLDVWRFWCTVYTKTACETEKAWGVRPGWQSSGNMLHPRRLSSLLGFKIDNIMPLSGVQ